MKRPPCRRPRHRRPASWSLPPNFRRRSRCVAAALALALTPLEWPPGGVGYRVGPLRVAVVPMPPFGLTAIGDRDPRAGSETWSASPRPGWLAFAGVTWPSGRRR